MWRVDFKYNNELTQTFMSSNQIGGFFNRLEASRKYLFGSMGVLGQTNDSIITGALILRGQDVKPVVDVAPDWESYEYKKLDLSNAEDKAYFEAALAWDLEIDGKKWVDGKNVRPLPVRLPFIAAADVYSLEFIIHDSSSKCSFPPLTLASRAPARIDVSFTVTYALLVLLPRGFACCVVAVSRNLHCIQAIYSDCRRLLSPSRRSRPFIEASSP